MALKKKISDQEIVAAAIDACDRLAPYTWDNSTRPQKVAWILKTRNEFRGMGIDVPYLRSVERLKRMADIMKHSEEKYRENDLMSSPSSDEDNDGFNPFGSGPEPIGRRVG